jgi:hypothetical protein
MAITKADLQQAARRHRLLSEVIGVALLAIIVYVSLGIVARRRIEPVRAEITKLGSAVAEVSQFRTAFKPSTPEQDVRMLNVPDSLSVALPRDQRVSLAQQIADRAERAGLIDLRVRFTLPDSAAAPDRPDLMSASVAVADYTLSVDCTGDFAAMLSLINHLPPSVAVQRITANRTKGGTQYHLILAVFEVAASGASQHG